MTAGREAPWRPCASAAAGPTGAAWLPRPVGLASECLLSIGVPPPPPRALAGRAQPSHRAWTPSDLSAFSRGTQGCGPARALWPESCNIRILTSRVHTTSNAQAMIATRTPLLYFSSALTLCVSSLCEWQVVHRSAGRALDVAVDGWSGACTLTEQRYGREPGSRCGARAR